MILATLSCSRESHSDGFTALPRITKRCGWISSPSARCFISSRRSSGTLSENEPLFKRTPPMPKPEQPASWPFNQTSRSRPRKRRSLHSISTPSPRLSSNASPPLSADLAAHGRTGPGAGRNSTESAKPKSAGSKVSYTPPTVKLALSCVCP